MTKVVIDGSNNVRSEIQEAFSAVCNRTNEALAKALEEVGSAAEDYAKSECPVDTGKLRESITHSVGDKEVYIGTNVEYAA